MVDEGYFPKVYQLSENEPHMNPRNGINMGKVAEWEKATMKDKTIKCIQFEKPFVFSVAEQERFLISGFATPKCCPECRKKKLKGVEVNEKWVNKVRQKRLLRRKKYEFYEI
jgi:hypothetical protein